MSLLTIAEARNHIETDIIDDALQQLIDDAEKEIDNSIGPVDSGTISLSTDNPSKIFWLDRKVESIDNITEERDSIETELDENDYRLINNGMAIERLTTGNNPQSDWGDYLTIEYVPVDDTDRRKRVIVDLVKLAVAYNGLNSRSLENYSESQKNYEDERAKLILRLCTNWIT